jgi:2-polyprenyl-3-methyl-5-hydroxy-6-metoxy-1,4-benzoquinol methylase
MVEQARRYREDVAWLLDRRDEFVEVDCPVCGCDRHEPEWTKFSLNYVACEACETVYMNPRPSPRLLAEYYRSSRNYEYWNRVIFPRSEAARRSKIFRPRAERVAEFVERYALERKLLVDVGAGFGTFCEEMNRLQLFERVIAVEPEPHLADSCRRKGINVIESPVEEADLEQADVVTNFEVIEHLFSPRDFIARCASVLRPGGLFVVTAPNVKGFDIRVLGERADAVDTEHLNYMHPHALGKLLESCGFEVLECGTPGRLDAELVRKKALSGEFDISAQPFLEEILIREWERLGEAFQDFLVSAGLSSNMWLLARRS